MEGYSSSDSNISLDSLETEFKKKPTARKKGSDQNVDTILVPFYEKDVLIKVPKSKKAKESNESYNVGDKLKKESQPIKNYLVHKDGRKPKCTSYLEMFRKQFAPKQSCSSKIQGEIRSISPEFGDTERESFGEEVNNHMTEFFNTESYNEMYYEKLINQDLNNYLEKTYDEQLKFTDNIRSKSPDDLDENNLRSVSEVSPARRVRRATVQPIQNVKLGGLGPDLENIKPRLERARSLQRYSEKVRMENRVKIYKKSIQEDMEKKAEKDVTVRRQESANKERQKSAIAKERKETENSYLVNKNIQDKPSQIVRRLCNSKSKSANVQRTKERDNTKEKFNVKNNNYNQSRDKKKSYEKAMAPNAEVSDRGSVKSSVDNKSLDTSRIKPVPAEVSVPPVQISFLVNMGGIRPSSALRTLEAKHRIYQEKVRAFTMANEKDNDNV